MLVPRYPHFGAAVEIGLRRRQIVLEEVGAPYELVWQPEESAALPLGRSAIQFSHAQSL